MGIYALFYIYRSARFDVVVFKASMLSCKGANLPYVYVHCSAIRCAKFGVAEFKASLLNWGVNQLWVYMHCSIYINLPSFV